MAWTRTSQNTWEIPGVAFVMKRASGIVTAYIEAGERVLELGDVTPKAARLAVEAAL